MAQLSITIPDEQVSRVLAAFAERTGVESPTPADVKAELVKLIKIIVRDHEKRAAEAAIVVSDVDAS